MPDVLVRDIDPVILARLDAVAQRRGVSRSVLLRDLLARFADEQRAEPLTDAEVAAFGGSIRGLGDAQVREVAWRR